MRLFLGAAGIFLGTTARVNFALLGFFNGALLGFDNGSLTTVLLRFRQIILRRGGCGRFRRGFLGGGRGFGRSRARRRGSRAGSARTRRASG